jgi:hypothetical protein
VDGNVLETLFCSPFEESTNMIHMAMDATVRAETQEMEGATCAA